MKNYCTVRHSIKGRLRIHIAGIGHNPSWFSHIDHALVSSPNILFVRSNAGCNSLIVHYKKKDLQEKEIVDQVNLCMQKLLPTLPNKMPSPKKKAQGKKPKNTGATYRCTGSPMPERDNPVRPALRRFLGISLVAGGVFIRKGILGLSVTQTAFSPLGLIAIAASLPLFKETFKQVKEKEVTLEGFLGAGCVAAVAAGEALTAFEILWVHSGAELLKAWITERSRKSISQILQVTSHHTFKFVENVEVETRVCDLKCGDIVVLHTGEKVCIDGEIIDGQALVDESPITGRPDFMHRSIGDKVLAGTFVRQGRIYVCAHKVGDQTYLSRVLRLVEDSLVHRAPVEGVADRLAQRLVKIGFVSTGLTFVLTGSLWRAFTVMLVMACPCATILAASTAVSAAIGAAAKKNILIKGGRYLEAVGKADCICFDKTGTLTTTEPELVEILLLKENDAYAFAEDMGWKKKDTGVSVKEIHREGAENALLQLLVSTEMHSHHPLAQAIKNEASRRRIHPIPHTCCEYFLGMGISATLNGHEVAVGNLRLMEHYKVKTEIEDIHIAAKVEDLRNQGKTVLFVAKDRDLIAVLAFDNIIRPEAREVIDILEHNGIKNTCLITGDEKGSALTLSNKLGIQKYYASIMPEEKADIIIELQKKHRSVLMVGDGINDAMALSQANIGIAMGCGGSEVAVEAADITLVNNDLHGIVYVHSLSQQTLRVVHQNFWIATGSNVLGVVLGGLGYLSPAMAGMLHIVHSLGVLANSSRLLYYETPRLALESKSKSKNLPRNTRNTRKGIKE